MINLAKYLADWLNYEWETNHGMVMVITPELLQKALDTFESTEEVIIKVLPCGDYELDRRLGEP